VVGVDPTPELVGRDGARRQGRVIGWRQSPDIAVIRVDEALPVSLPWAKTESLTEGQSLVALGYPVPDLDFSVTDAAIVSFQSRAGVRRAVRTDGALDRGNSGGPALTAAGEVAGVVTEMEANESGLQLVALLYTADALAADVQAILDRPTSSTPPATQVARCCRRSGGRTTPTPTLPRRPTGTATMRRWTLCRTRAPMAT
jgi:S1-C subfamily serine protease